MKKHFVKFYSPGTLVSEETSIEIGSWDVREAIELSKGIKERHGATPFAFDFITMDRGDDDLNAKEVDRSQRYFLGGKILTLDEIKRKNDPADSILISNMECNGWDRVIENNNSWKTVQPLRENDIVLEYEANSN